MAWNLIYFRMLGYMATIVMHFVNTVSMSLVLQGDEAVELFKNPTVKFFNDNQVRYFTCWTFWVYACIGLTCDYLTLKNSGEEGYRLNVHLRWIRDTLFSAIVWPTSLLVFTIFWGLYHIDRELILPPVLDKVLTRTSNHVIHSAIIPVVLWELACRPRFEPRSHLYNISHTFFHYLLYHSVLFYTYYEQGKWIYPVFKKLWGTALFPAFCIFVLVLLLSYYYIQWPLTKLIHGSIARKKKV